MVTVTADGDVMLAVSHDAATALATTRRRLRRVAAFVVDVPPGPERHRLEDVVDDVATVLHDLAVVMGWPRVVAVGMADLERRAGPGPRPRATGTVATVPTVGATPPTVRRDLEVLVAHAGTPAAVARRWARLPDDRRDALVAAHGPTVANLDGIPIDVRDAVHRATIATELARLSRASPPPGLLVVPGNDVVGAATRRDLARRRTWLEDVATADHVLVLDLAGDGRAVLAVGDPSRADHVATVVPGIGTTVRDAGRLLGDARALRDRARSVGGGTVATVAWLGYDPPPGPVAAAIGLARHDPTALVLATTALVADDARASLARHVAAVRVANPGVHHTLVGHSYGSVVVLRALGVHPRIDAPRVADVVVLGSPGGGPGVDREVFDWPDGVGLFSARARTDPIPRLPVLGPDPVDLGATPLPQGPGNRGHVRYLAPDTVGLATAALVVAGAHGCPVPPTDPVRPVRPTAPAW